MTPTSLTFSEAVAQVILSHGAQVHAVLAQEPARFSAVERAYLQAWIACEAAGTSPGLFTPEQEACWTQAAEILAAARDELLVVPGACTKRVWPGIARPSMPFRRRRTC